MVGGLTAYRSCNPENDGGIVGTAAGKVATNPSGCQISWVDFDVNTGQALPRGVVVGGRLSDGTPLYIMRTRGTVPQGGGSNVPGYYNHAAQKTYYELGGCKTNVVSIQLLTSLTLG